MTVVSLAQAARRLGIDAKTLHRWLADAKLPLHRDPHDARTKGVSEEDLQRLACLHQRHLTPVLAQPVGPVLAERPALPPALVALPEQLRALQTQLTALQQQVAQLTGLLQQSAHPPLSLTAHPSSTRTRSPKRVPPASRTRPEARAKPPHKPVHVIPRVEYGGEGHYVVICPRHGLLPFEPDTPEWLAWVDKQSSFRFVGKLGHFTAHHFWRVPRGAWRAHRQIRNQSYNLRLAPSRELTIAVLEQAAEALQAHLK